MSASPPQHPEQWPPSPPEPKMARGGGASSAGGTPRSGRHDVEDEGRRPPTAQSVNWMPDSASASCLVCFLPWTMIRRRHHCRTCGRLVCGNCSQKRLYLTPGSPNPQRVCEQCFALHEKKMTGLARVEIADMQRVGLADWSCQDRRGLWCTVVDTLERQGVEGLLPPGDMDVVRQLAQGKRWMDWMDEEHVSCYESLYEEHVGQPSQDVDWIEKDVPRTLPAFMSDPWLLSAGYDVKTGDEQTEALRRLLNLGALVTDDGYCQGMNFVAAVMMLPGSFTEPWSPACEKEAFVALAWVLNRAGLDVLYAEHGAIVRFLHELEHLLEREAPAIYHRFVDLGFLSVNYSMEWITTLYTTNFCKLFTLSLIDLFMAGVEGILLRAAVAVIQLVEDSIMDLDFEQLHTRLKQLTWGLPAEAIMAKALCVSPAGTTGLLQISKRHTGDGVDRTPEGIKERASTRVREAVEKQHLRDVQHNQEEQG